MKTVTQDAIIQKQFLDFMQIDGRPLVSADTFDWLVGQGFFCEACCNQASWQPHRRSV